MSTYCQRIRPTDWYEPEPESYWHEVQKPSDDIQWLVEEHAETIAKVSVIVHSVDREESLAERFREQAEKWQEETQHLSSPGQRMMHPSYQAILGMASDRPREVISLMIRDMQRNRRPWFWALSYLAQDNPISASDAGKTDKMIKAWVRWGEAKGLL